MSMYEGLNSITKLYAGYCKIVRGTDRFESVPFNTATIVTDTKVISVHGHIDKLTTIKVELELPGNKKVHESITAAGVFPHVFDSITLVDADCSVTLEGLMIETVGVFNTSEYPRRDQRGWRITGSEYSVKGLARHMIRNY